VEPKDKFAKPVMIEVREYTITFVGGLERVLRLRPEDVLTHSEAKERLNVEYPDGRQHTIYMKNAIDTQFRTYKQAARPKPTPQ
jgi:hypothetical protein